MKKFFFSAILIVSLILVGCSETETENLGGTVANNSEEDNSTENNSNNANEEGNNSNDANEEDNNSEDTEESKVDQIIADDENYKVTLLEIVKKSDDIFGDSIEVVFEIENKLDHTIVAQARSVSADGYMVDETIISMSQEVAAEKKAKAVLSIEDFDDYDFPELEEDFEMTLLMIDEETYENIAEHEVKVSF